MWLDPGMEKIMQVRWSRASWKGLWDPEPLDETARAMCRRYQPRIPYFLTLTEIPRMRAHIVAGEQVTWRHLAACCAVPCGFPPVRLDGRLYVDGGVLGAMPLWAAVDRGATHAVAVDSLPEMPSRIIRAAARLACRIGGSTRAGAGIPVLRVTRGRSLGTLGDAIHWSAENARRWIGWGEADGAEAARQLASDHALPLK
jgi:NTE family protein